ncbi:MAG: hypothetical protein JHC74_01445 [Thermoleophilia bacterium]|nr:hypothetical protein [Thermoleophilia bacterium]
MGRPPRYREPVKGPFDFLARAWSRDAQVRARRGNRKAFWGFSNLWYKPGRIFMVIGIVLAILLLIEDGGVRGGACLTGAGCVSWGEQGIVTTPAERVVIGPP